MSAYSILGQSRTSELHSVSLSGEYGSSLMVRPATSNFSTYLSLLRLSSDWKYLLILSALHAFASKGVQLTRGNVHAYCEPHGVMRYEFTLKLSIIDYCLTKNIPCVH